MVRSTREVVEDHLERAKRGDVDGDLAANYAEDCIFISHFGTGRGRAEGRRLADILMEELPDQQFEYHQVLFEGDVGFLVWSGTSAHSRVPYGTDTYVVRDGLIVVQTLYYTVEYD